MASRGDVETIGAPSQVNIMAPLASKIHLVQQGKESREAMDQSHVATYLVVKVVEIGYMPTRYIKVIVWD